MLYRIYQSKMQHEVMFILQSLLVCGAKKKIAQKKFSWLVCWFYSLSTFVGYLTPNPFYVNNLFYLKQFSLA